MVYIISECGVSCLLYHVRVMPPCRSAFHKACLLSSESSIQYISPFSSMALIPCVGVLETGFLQTFITKVVWEYLMQDGAVSAGYKRQTVPRSWGGFRKSSLLRTSGYARCNVHFFCGDETTASLAVGVYLVSGRAIRISVMSEKTNGCVTTGGWARHYHHVSMIDVSWVSLPWHTIVAALDFWLLYILIAIRRDINTTSLSLTSACRRQFH